MAIKVQEVTLRVVYDDAEIQKTPGNWGWQDALNVGGARVGHSFCVAEVQATDVRDPSENDLTEYQER
jgi:hypothetical protein